MVLRHLIMSLLGLVLAVSPVSAADNIFSSPASLAEEVQHLGEEALQVVKTPVDMESGGFLGTLAVAGAVGLTYVFDDDIRDKLQGKRGSTLDKAADAGSAIGHPLVHLGVAAAVYGGGVFADSPKWRETGQMLGEAALLADASGFVLKQVIGRGRPLIAADKGDFTPFQFRSEYDSLPSLHTASSFAMASVMAATSESILAKVFYYSAASFVGFSRMYQQKHWASDVVLGAALGELCGRVVTGYHARGDRITLVPVVGEQAVLLSLQGKW